VYETEQVPEERVHDDSEKFPVPVAAHVIVPVGESPLTVAVQVDARVTIAGEGAQETEAVETLGAKLSPTSAQPSLVCG
jgi:hypothetical protein